MDEKLKQAQKRKEAIIFNLIVVGVSFAVGAIIFVIYYFAMGAHLIDAVNGAAVSFIVLFAGAILSLLARFGAFDTFAYGFLQLGTAMFSHNPRKYNSMADYKQAKYDARKEKFKAYIPILITSGLFAIALLVLEIVYHSHIGQ